jgi:acetyl-CoA acetyltransferase
MFPETDAAGLGVSALWAALDDAGISRDEVDALVSMRIPEHGRFCELAGIAPDTVVPFPAYGRLTSVAIQTAAQLIESGVAQVVALVYGNHGRSELVRYGGDDWEEDQSLWRAWGMTSPGAEQALMFRRHQAQYGTTTEQLGAVSVTFRSHAERNPTAIMRRPITIADHEESRPIVLPLRLLDYCLINDGGAALVVTRVERAADGPHPVVRILGTASAGDLRSDSFPPDDFWFAAFSRCAERVFAAAEVTPADVGCAQIYDNFTPNVLFTLEGFGFCPPGESGPFCADGGLALDGRLPSNTTGGHLSESYMQGWTLNVEAVRQVRGEAGERQAPDTNVVMYMAGAPICSAVVYGAA